MSVSVTALDADHTSVDRSVEATTIEVDLRELDAKAHRGVAMIIGILSSGGILAGAISVLPHVLR